MAGGGAGAKDSVSDMLWDGGGGATTVHPAGWG